MVAERTTYRERSPWPGWVKAILWGSAVLCSYPIIAGWDHELPLAGRLWVVLGIFGAMGLLAFLLGGLTVEVRETGILVHMGRVPLIHRRIPFEEIEGVRAVRYRPIREFGGWGIRGFGRRKIWSSRGDRAVALELVGDRELLLGSDHPQRLEERIRQAIANAG